jgi:hypothetical protein
MKSRCITSITRVVGGRWRFPDAANRVSRRMYRNFGQAYEGFSAVRRRPNALCSPLPRFQDHSLF